MITPRRPKGGTSRFYTSTSAPLPQAKAASLLAVLPERKANARKTHSLFLTHSFCLHARMHACMHACVLFTNFFAPQGMRGRTPSKGKKLFLFNRRLAQCLYNNEQRATFAAFPSPVAFTATVHEASFARGKQPRAGQFTRMSLLLQQAAFARTAWA
ncbi:hypothetical protein GPALN_007813 [Globodera pallida]|nr:hypothetical protein GPALN_007813 [Globodera pallida]